MKWIETIELRSTAGRDFLKNIDLKGLITGFSEGCKPYQIVLFKHGSVKSDLSIHLMFDTKTVPREGSEAGLWLKEMLRTAGLVSHKIWIETASHKMPKGDDPS
jgi:hypothetical protein